MAAARANVVAVVAAVKAANGCMERRSTRMAPRNTPPILIENAISSARMVGCARDGSLEEAAEESLCTQAHKHAEQNKSSEREIIRKISRVVQAGKGEGEKRRRQRERLPRCVLEGSRHIWMA